LHQNRLTIGPDRDTVAAMARFQMPPVPASVGAALADRGLLARASDVGKADVILKGGTYRYLPALWERVGALTRTADGDGWALAARSPEERLAARRRLAAEWESAGAPSGWALAEADAALASLVATWSLQEATRGRT
jgi:hypothetical protein